MGFDTVLRQFADPPNRFRMAPFWFLNHQLSEDGMRWQVREMHRQGAGGFVLHPRHGLLTEYFSEDWMRCLGAAIDEAKKLGMKAYLYDENNWPSGTANGRVIEETPEYRMSGVKLVQEFDVTGPTRWRQQVDARDSLLGVVAVPLRDGVPVDFPESAVAVELPAGGADVEWDTPPGDWRVYVFAREFLRGGQFAGLFLGGYVDTLNASAVQRFIELSYKVYAERFGEEFGDTIIGMFTDEPTLNSNPPDAIAWTPTLPGEFGWRSKYDLVPALPALFHDMGPATKRIRSDYYECVTELYVNSFYKQLHDYCDEHRLALMGHAMWDGELLEQVRQEGDFFRCFEHMHWGGCDLLLELTWPERDEFLNNLLAPKFASSAAHILGKEVVMCEAFGLGGQWGIDLRNLKWMADWIVALGCNHLQPHAFYYSLQGFRKWECPPGEFYQSPFWPHYRALADYVGRLCALFTGGRHVADVALLYPNKSLWAEMGPNATAETGTVVESFNSTSRALTALNVDYDIVPEESLATEWFGRLTVESPAGEPCEEDYKALVIPACTTISRETAALLVQLHLDGVPFIATGRLPSASVEEGEGDPLIAACFSDIFGEDAYLASLSAPDSDGVIAPEPQEGLATLVACPRNIADAEMEVVLLDAIEQAIYPDVSVREKGGHVPDIVHIHTIREGIHLFLLVNTSRTKSHRAEITLDIAGAVYRLDPETGTVAAACHYETDTEACSTTITLEFLPTQAFVLAVDPGGEGAFPADGECFCALAARRPVGTPVVLADDWRFSTEKPNALPLRDWSYSLEASVRGRDSAAERAHYVTTFEARHVPSEARLLMDGLVVEKVWRGTTPVDVTVSVNGQRLERFEKGEYLDHFILEADLAGLLREGTNEVVIETEGHLYDTPALRYPPTLVGRFALEQADGGLVLGEEPDAIPGGDWTQHGYPYYSGIGVFEQSFAVPEEWAGKRIFLQLEQVGDLTDVWVNGRHAGMRAWEPFEVEITDFAKPGENALTLKVANSLQNLLCDTPKPSGVLGEVRIGAFEVG